MHAKTLHLVLKGVWYDKIASGEKTVEYRECKPYWEKRLTPIWTDLSCMTPPSDTKWTVVFHRGYTNTIMEFEIIDCGTTAAQNDLNLAECWEIRLGKRIK